MEYWEFLIQKEGDRSWLPLETADVEILEGRYRVVARSSHKNSPVEIRVTYHCMEEFPPKRRVQKRKGRTNEEGAIVVIPFTRLKPGLWELSCIGEELPADGKPFHQSVVLDVLAVDVEMTPDSTPSPSVDAAEPSDPEDSAVDRAIAADAETPETPPTPEPPSEAIVVEAVASATASPAPPAAPTEPTPKTSPSEKSLPTGDRPISSPVAPLLLRLSLDRETQTVRWGSEFTIAGRIEGVDPGDRSPLDGVVLHVELRNPQTGTVVVERREDLTARSLPFSFACALTIPRKCDTHLVLGEVKLYDTRGGEGEDTLRELTSRSLTITADLYDLLGALPLEMEAEEVLEYSQEALLRRNAEVLGQSFEELIETIGKSQPISFQPSNHPVLPPQLAPPSPASPPRAKKPLDLPSFGRSPAPPPPAPPPPGDREDRAAATPAPESEDGSADPEQTRSEIAENGAQATPPTETPEERQPEVAPEPVPPQSRVDRAFASLNLEDRFFSRLNALANDAELSEWLETNLSRSQGHGGGESLVTETGDVDGEEATVGEEPDWEASEIVIDEEEMTPDPSSSALTPVLPPSGRGDRTVEIPAGMVLAEDEPVPTPTIEIYQKELVSGRPVKVTLRLPDIVPRLYVKLWLEDRQTREILDGPHWVVEFWPSGSGDKFATTEVLVPYGCLEVQFEAIAVEVQTDRESHKVVLERRVLPPEPPRLPLDGE